MVQGALCDARVAITLSFDPPFRQWAQWSVTGSAGVGRLEPHLTEWYAPRWRGVHIIPWERAGVGEVRMRETSAKVETMEIMFV